MKLLLVFQNNLLYLLLDKFYKRYENLFLALVFVTIGKVLIASDCNLQLNFAGKNNIWKR